LPAFLVNCMFYIKICELTVKIENKYDFVYKLCKDYIADNHSGAFDFSVSVTDEQVAEEHSKAEFDAPLGYCESVCLYREISFKMLDFGAFLFHSAVIEVDGEAFAFAAPSGTGKSTHISLWLKHFGERAAVVNGDKPLMRFCGDVLYAYGTPWCGKERLQNNIKSPLKALCFLKRGEENKIRKIDQKELIGILFQQTILPKDPDRLTKIFDLLAKMLRIVPCYSLECDMTEQAAIVAYEGMKG
jgi:hypothetical protein